MNPCANCKNNKNAHTVIPAGACPGSVESGTGFKIRRGYDFMQLHHMGAFIVSPHIALDSTRQSWIMYNP